MNTDADVPKKKDDEETKGGAVPLPVPASRRRKNLLLSLLMLLFFLLTSSYLLIWLMSALRSPDMLSGNFRWPPPPKLGDLPEAVSSIYASLKRDKPPADAASAKAPADAWDGISKSDKSPKTKARLRPMEKKARLAPPPRLQLIPYFYGQPVAKSGAFLEAQEIPRPAESSISPQLQNGALLGAGGNTGGLKSRRKYRYCQPNEKPTQRDPCIADASDKWVKWPLGLHPKAFTVSPELIAKLRDPGPYPENIIDEEEENRPRAVEAVLTSEDVDVLFEAVTGISEGQTLRSRTAYAQLVEARGHSIGASRCSVCKPDSRILNDRGSYYGEKMKLQ